MHQINPNILALVVIAIFCTHSSIAAGPETNNTIEQAIEQLETAIGLSQDADSGHDVKEAAAMLAFVLERDGIESAGGHLTLGNAYFIGHDLGRAVLHYRRGLEIDPSNTQLQQNLAHARSFVDPVVPLDGKRTTVQSVVQSWHRVTDGGTLWLGVILVMGLASLLWTVRVIGSTNRIPRKLPIAVTMLGLLGFGLLAFDQWIIDHDRGLVVVMPGTGMYSGPGTGVYSKIYDGPLGVGTEALILESKDGWMNILLANDQAGWVLTDSIMPVTISSN